MDAHNFGNSNGLVSKLYQSKVIMNKDSTNHVNGKKKQLSNLEGFCWKKQIRFFITPKEKSKQNSAGSSCSSYPPATYPIWKDVAPIISQTLGILVYTSFASPDLRYIPENMGKYDLLKVNGLILIDSPGVLKVLK